MKVTLFFSVSNELIKKYALAIALIFPAFNWLN